MPKIEIDPMQSDARQPKRRMPVVPADARSLSLIGFERWLGTRGVALAPPDRPKLDALGDLDRLRAWYVTMNVPPTIEEIRQTVASHHTMSDVLAALSNLHPTHGPHPVSWPTFDIAGTEVADHKMLYETHRRALITRHICRDGFLAGEVWMVEQADDDLRGLMSNPAPFKDVSDAKLHMRCRREWHYQADKSIAESTFCFLPVAYGGRAVMPTSENHLLNAGLALATFSMEAICGVSKYAHRYARLLFNGICKSELHGNGMLYRARIDGDQAVETRYASTDDMLGVCVGLMFYKQYLDKAGVPTDDPERAAFVKFAERVGHVLDWHGCFYLPPSKDHDVELEFTEKLAFPFTYPLKLLFKNLCKVELENEWDWDEYKAYFSEIPGDELFGPNITSIEHKAIADFAHYFDFSSDSHFELLLGLYTAAVDGSFDQFLQQPGVKEVWGLIDDILGFGGVSTPKDISDTFLTKNFFNLHLTALSLLIMQQSGGRIQSAVPFLRAVLNGKLSDTTLDELNRCPGARNSLFATIAGSIDPASRSSAEVQSALAFLCTASPGTGARPLQHDAPLARNDGLAALLHKASAPPLPTPPLTLAELAMYRLEVAYYAKHGENWVPRLQAINPLHDLNPRAHVGKDRMFEKPQVKQVATNRLDAGAEAIIVPLLLKRNERYTANGLFRQATVNDQPLLHGLTAAVECAEVSWMFTKMLSMYLLGDQDFRLSLQSDTYLPPLPYSGHFPVVKK